MKNYYVRRVVLSLVMALLMVAAVHTALVMAQGPDITVISSPTEGQTVSGVITVTGAVDFPGFLKYEVFLKTGEQMAWGATVYAPVINGNLARLDTRTFLDGTYQLIIRKVRTDNNYDDFVGPSFTIDNNLGAPLPHPEVQSSFLYPPTSGNALARVLNCSGKDLEFDYTSPEGFCSAADLWIMPKPQDATLCTTVDILLIPCEYRGTAVTAGDRGGTYMFTAEGGRVYEIIYPGNDQIIINQIPGDPRASTDTGGLPLDDPDRPQTIEEILAGGASMSVAPAAPAAPAEPAPQSESELPVSGAPAETTAPFAIAAASVLVLMVIGGVVAMRRGKQSA